MHPRKILVTGGAGFIGSCFIRFGMAHIPYLEKIVNLDLLTYAANLKHLEEISGDERYTFAQGDICDQPFVESLIVQHGIDTIVHFAAESHVDNSINDPHSFYKTNIGGTIALLEAVRRYKHVHFHHVSTDEVFGSLGKEGAFTEASSYHPNSPYSASKASSDHFVKAYGCTYGLGFTLSYSSNNYGPCQHAEKMIPRMITCLLEGEPLPIYGNGKNIRDWLFVEDHVHALWFILERGKRDETYAIGGGTELTNLELVHHLIKEVAEQTDKNAEEFTKLITFVTDRAGHDFRYAIDSAKVNHELGWHPRVSFADGLKQTVSWTLAHHSALSCSS